MLSHALRAASVLPTFTYNGTAADSTDLTTYSFAGVSIGTAATNRLVYVQVNFNAAAARRISSATIGGISATIIDTAGQGNGTFVIYANVPTGTTATISITFDAVCTRCVIGSYSLFNLKSQEPVAIAYATTWTAGAISAPVDVPDGGIIIAGVNNNTNNNTITWTSGVNLNYSTAVDTTFRSGGASNRAIPGGIGYTITANATSATAGRLAVYVWR